MSLPFRAIPGYHAEAYCSACESWSPLERWNDYDEFDDDRWVESPAICPHCGHHHPPYDPPVRPTRLPRCVCGTRNDQMGCAVHETGSYADTREGANVNDDTDRRWSGFTDEELLELRAGCEGRVEVHALPQELRLRANRLSVEIWRELRRRRGGYRGPGVYRGNVAAEGASAPEYEVYGAVGPISGADRMLVVRADPDSDELMMVSLRSFERLMSSNQPSYEWVRPLPGREER